MSNPEHYHRLERPGTQVTVRLGDEILARSRDAIRLSEFVRGRALDPVYYIPRRDVVGISLKASDKRTSCPIKGEASYWSVTLDQTVEEDLAWSYQSPIGYSETIRGYLAFDSGRVTIEAEEEG